MYLVPIISQLLGDTKIMSSNSTNGLSTPEAQGKMNTTSENPSPHSLLLPTLQPLDTLDGVMFALEQRVEDFVSLQLSSVNLSTHHRDRLVEQFAESLPNDLILEEQSRLHDVLESCLHRSGLASALANVFRDNLSPAAEIVLPEGYEPPFVHNPHYDKRKSGPRIILFRLPRRPAGPEMQASTTVIEPRASIAVTELLRRGTPYPSNGINKSGGADEGQGRDKATETEGGI